MRLGMLSDPGAFLLDLNLLTAISTSVLVKNSVSGITDSIVFLGALGNVGR